MSQNENRSFNRGNQSSPSGSESDLVSSGDDRWDQPSSSRSRQKSHNESRRPVKNDKKRSRSDSPVSGRSKKTKVTDAGDAVVKAGPRPLPGSPQLLLVLDTNILLEHTGLEFLRGLAEGRFDGDGLPLMQVMVPHVVLIELDRQKTRHHNGLAVKACAAIRFLNDQLTNDAVPPSSTDSGPATSSANADPVPRFLGQTLRDFTQAGKDFQQEVDDDHVMFCCMQMQARKNQAVPGVVWCLTNDRNLRTRTVINGVPAFSLGVLLQNIDKKKAGQSSVFDTFLVHTHDHL